MPSLRRVLLQAACAAPLTLGLAPATQAATIFDPAITWRTIVTPHFRVNFPAEHEAIARLAAGYAEEAHEKLAPWLRSEPEQRTELTLLDSEDTTNGFGFPLPNNQIFIYLSSPPADQLMGRYDSWLRDLLLHEYTHVLHLEKTEGLPALVKRVIGRSWFPNMLQPIFLIEGLAVHTETAHSTGGRGRDTAYRMYLRTAALNGRLAGIDQASGYFTIDPPGGEIPYVYGMAFYRHLATRYGADAPARLAHAHAANLYAGLWGLDDELRALTGKDAQGLWRDLMAELEADARAQRATILARGPLTPLTLVTRAGMHQRHPRFLPDGSLAWAGWTGHAFAQVSVRDAGKPAAKPRRLLGKSPFGSWDVSRDGRWAYHARNWDENRFTGYEDLFRYDLKARRLERLSQRARLDMPAISPDGRTLVAVHNAGAQTTLVRMRADGTGRVDLTQLTDRSQLSSPTWHPRLRLLALSAWRGGARDLYLVNPDTGALRAPWRDRAVDQDPTWTPDGRYVIFSSDRDGVFNLYAWDWLHRRLFRVTNVLGGVIEPAVSPDGRTIAASSYGPKGWDIVTLPLDPATWRLVPTPGSEPGLRQPPPAVPPPTTPATAYDPWPSLRPKLWAPFGFFDERGPVWGFQTFGQDVLMQHFAFGAFGWGLLSGRPFYSVSYSNEVWYPSLSAYATDTTLLSAPLHAGRAHTVVQRGRYQGVSATFPGLPSIFLQNQWATGDTVTLAFSAQHVQDEMDVAALGLPERLRPQTGQTNTLAATWRFADNYKHAWSISPEGGNLGTLGYEKALPALGSQHAFDRVWLDWRRYAALPWEHHVLAWRLSGGTSVGGGAAGDFYLGGSDSATLLANVDLRTASGVGTRSVPLRGYAFAAQRGPSVAAFSAEWRFPLLPVQRGWGTVPFFVRNLHGAVFTEAGQAWEGAFDWRRSLLDVGLELRAQTHVQQAPTEVRLGIGQGLVTPGGGVPWPVAFFELGSYF
ncbi:MAG: BamA/TamA family outer membrane protein [Candidatus Sericytochromatia bacterium]|nr:BamA/TamA family outer membrane protein [Candidatus Sericytochromatia bacterium]